jgi:hypothetical protein
MNVIGPIAFDDWYLLRMLRESVRHAKETNPTKYRLMIDVHQKTYKDLIRSYL